MSTELLEKTLAAELEKLYPGIKLHASTSIPLNDTTAHDISEIKRTLSSLFNLQECQDQPKLSALVLILFRQRCFCFNCRLTTRLCDLSVGITKELWEHHMRESLVGEDELDVLKHLRYSMVEFRIIKTEVKGRIKPVVWLKAEEPSASL